MDHCFSLSGLLVYWAVADPTAEHHGEDHLEDLNGEKVHNSLIQGICFPLSVSLSWVTKAGF